MNVNIQKYSKFLLFQIVLAISVSCYEEPIGVGLLNNEPPLLFINQPTDNSSFTDFDSNIQLSLEIKNFVREPKVYISLNQKNLNLNNFSSPGFINSELFHTDSVNIIYAAANDIVGNLVISNIIRINYRKTINIKNDFNLLEFLDKHEPYTIQLEDYFFDTMGRTSELEYSYTVFDKLGKFDIKLLNKILTISPLRNNEGSALIRVTAKNGSRFNYLEFFVKIFLTENLNGVYIPDENFRDILVNNYGFRDLGKELVSIDKANGLTELDLSSHNYSTRIKNFEGLQYFTNLVSLNVSGNEIEHIDLSNHLELKKLDCSTNRILKLDISMLLELEELNFLFNYNITDFDVSNNLQLKSLACNLDMKTLDLSKNIKLEDLSFGECRLENINLSTNTNLKNFGITSHDIKEIDLSTNINLEKLVIHWSLLKELDISNNQKLTSVNLTYNEDLIKTIVWELPLPDYVSIEMDEHNILVTNP